MSSLIRRRSDASEDVRDSEVDLLDHCKHSWSLKLDSMYFEQIQGREDMKGRIVPVERTS